MSPHERPPANVLPWSYISLPQNERDGERDSERDGWMNGWMDRWMDGWIDIGR